MVYQVFWKQTWPLQKQNWCIFAPIFLFISNRSLPWFGTVHRIMLANHSLFFQSFPHTSRKICPLQHLHNQSGAQSGKSKLDKPVWSHYYSYCKRIKLLTLTSSLILILWISFDNCFMLTQSSDQIFLSDQCWSCAPPISEFFLWNELFLFSFKRSIRWVVKFEC